MFGLFYTDDLYKALIALTAGIILGMERELKDKSAGLKTISVITMGAALFAILSYRMGSAGEYTRIASYVVAGIGFLGAGVIFRDTVNVTGLTTASVIWLASAIGMAIGFGQVFPAFIFLFLSLIIIHFPQSISRFFHGGRVSRMLVITIHKKDAALKSAIVGSVKNFLLKCDERRLKLTEDKLIVYLDITLKKSKLGELERFLIGKEQIQGFEL
ncbi:MAG: MgtC/SapB family protein [Niabella sp.]